MDYVEIARKNFSARFLALSQQTEYSARTEYNDNASDIDSNIRGWRSCDLESRSDTAVPDGQSSAITFGKWLAVESWFHRERGARSCVRCARYVRYTHADRSACPRSPETRNIAVARFSAESRKAVSSVGASGVTFIGRQCITGFTKAFAFEWPAGFRRTLQSL